MPDKDKRSQSMKKRVSKACDCCRKSKTKCDGQRPCTRCLQDGKICTYMNKKKADRMYPASYVDLLETRVSILVQSLSQLMNKSEQGFEEFCSDQELLNKDGEFDINKVICKLLPNEKLNNLAESSDSYTIDDITHVSDSFSNSSPESEAQSSSKISSRSLSQHSHSSSNFNSNPSSPANSTETNSSHIHGSSHHYSLSRARRNSDNHIHKLHNRKHQSNSSSSSLASSFKAKFDIYSPESYFSNGSASLDITNQFSRTPPKEVENSLDSFLNQDNEGSTGLSHLRELDLDNINFSDSHSNSNSTLMSPVLSFTDDTFPDQINRLNSPIDGIFLDSKPSGFNQDINLNNSFGGLDVGIQMIKTEDKDDMGFNWNLPQFTTNSDLKFEFDP